MTLLILLLGIFFVLGMTILINRSKRFRYSESNKIYQRLSSWRWIQNPWFCGTAVFVLNGIIFSLILGLFMLNFLVLLLPLLGIGLSFLLWFSVKQVFLGKGLKRYLMSLLGSSFYLMLAIYFLYRLVNLTPQYEGEDTFMAAMGLSIASIITSTAFITGFMTLVLPTRR